MRRPESELRQRQGGERDDGEKRHMRECPWTFQSEQLTPISFCQTRSEMHGTRTVPKRTERPMIADSVLLTPAHTLTVKAFGITDRGQVRATNEDQFLIAELSKSMRVWQTSLPEPKLQVGEERAHLFLVAD